MRGLRLRLALACFVTVGTLAVSVCPSAAQAPTAVQIGGVVPSDAAYMDLDGKLHKFGDLRGKVVFVHFWSVVCPTEKSAEPKFVDIQKQFGAKVVQIAVNANQRELQPPYADLRNHAEQAGLNFTIAVDPGNKVTDLLGGTNTPHCFVIDKDGTLRYAGALDDDPRGTKGAGATPYVKDAIQALIDGKPVAVASTRPYG